MDHDGEIRKLKKQIQLLRDVNLAIIEAQISVLGLAVVSMTDDRDKVMDLFQEVKAAQSKAFALLTEIGNV